MLSDFRRKCEKHFSQPAPPFQPGKTKIPLNAPSYGADEVCEALESMMTTFVTMGKKVSAFEKSWADYVGTKHAIMVNSGSSANLLALFTLANPAISNPIRPGDEVIVPAVGWSTTFYPIINAGAVPVLVDVDMDTLDIDPAAAQAAIGPRTRAIMPVHLLGNPADMKTLGKIANDRRLYLIEDTCEAHGAMLDGRKAGSMSDIGTFSFFFSHHISTIEGGMLVTNDENYANIARSLRAHGWPRERTDYKALAAMYPSIDSRFLFVNSGFNLRPTDLQGAFGIHQVKKLEDFIRIRRDNAAYWGSKLAPYDEWLHVTSERPGTRHAWFGYPITVRPGVPFTRQELTAWLESRGIETRPVMSGNMAEQPVMKMLPHRILGELPNAKLIHRNSFFFGNHQNVGQPEREWIADSIIEFVEKRTKR